MVSQAGLQTIGGVSLAESTMWEWCEVKRLQMERDILKKATAFFAKESE